MTAAALLQLTGAPSGTPSWSQPELQPPPPSPRCTETRVYLPLTCRGRQTATFDLQRFCLWASIRQKKTGEDCPTCVPSAITSHAWTLRPKTYSPAPHPPLSSPPGRAHSCGSDRPPLQGIWGNPVFIYFFRINDYLYLFCHGNCCCSLK